MPRIVACLDGFDRYAWVATVYLLTSTVAIPVFGKLSDSYGRKMLLLIGITIFAIASVFSGMAGVIPLIGMDGMTQIIVSRGFQGIGGGIILALCFAAVADITSPADRGRYQGQFAAVFALASIAGPTLGGWVADKASWRWIFLLNVPFALAAIVILAIAFPYMKAKSSQSKIDLVGMLTFTFAFVPLLLSLSWAANEGLMAPRVIVSGAIAMVMFVVFIWLESRQVAPLIPPELFKMPVVSISAVSLFVTGIGMYGSILLVPLLLQTMLGTSQTLSGALLTPLIVTVAVSSVGGGYWMSQSGKYKNIALTGLLLMTVGTLLLATINAGCPLTIILVYMLSVGCGLGLLLPIYTVVIQNAVPQRLLGTVTGFAQFFRSIGGAVGTAVFGSLMLSCYNDHLARTLPPNVSSIAMPLLKDPLQIAKIKTQLTITLSSQVNPGALIEETLRHVNDSLVAAMDNVLLLYGILLASTLVTNFFLQELPLRKFPALDSRKPASQAAK